MSSFLQWFFSFPTLFCQEEDNISHTCRRRADLIVSSSYLEYMELVVLNSSNISMKRQSDTGLTFLSPTLTIIR